MSLVAGAKLGPYEIQSLLGAGGMGEVYRAHDAKLRRDVAIKVLPADVARDPDRLAKFRREAQLLASLNHPNIAAIYGLEEAEGQMFLVLELVEGEDLSEHLKRGPIPVAEAITFARQIAAALEAAHEKGIVHRDLKPANIKVGPDDDGKVKVLDFGLAKAMAGDSASGSGSSLANSPTFTAYSQTVAGVVLGTAAYMAPEQARGKTVDKRADVWSFGVVLYEMLTGKHLFGGETVTDILACVLTREPEWSDLPPDTPDSVRRLLHRALQKDPRMRLRDMGDAGLELENAGAEKPGIIGVVAATPVRSRVRAALPWAVAALVAMLALVGMHFSNELPETRSVRLSLVPPPNLKLNDSRPDWVVISPDGQKIVFSAASEDGKRQLWVRSLDSMEVQPLPGTEDPILPFWSPDSRSVAFGSHGKLKRVDLGGGSSQVLCDAARLVGGSWSRNGVIVFGPDYGALLSQVPATGGEPRRAGKTESEGDLEQASPNFLSDGKHFLYRTSRYIGGRGIWVGTLDSAEQKQLLPDGSDVGFAPPNWILLVRNDVLMAQALDLGSLQLKGDAVPIAARPPANPRPHGLFSASGTGTITWQGNWERAAQLIWFDRNGKELGAVGDPALVATSFEPRLSPDGKRVVFRRGNNLWVADLARNTEIRLTSAFTQFPVWSADGRGIVFDGASDGKSGILQKSANATGEAESLLPGHFFPQEISPDGRSLLYLRRGAKTRFDVWVLALSGPRSNDRRTYPLLDSAFEEDEPVISRDGRWLAYVSDESGTPDIYVRSFTADGKVGNDKKRISSNGGVYPRWRGDGQELFYVALDGQMMSVPVKSRGNEFEYETPKALFKTRMLDILINPAQYDVTADGKRFLIGATVGEAKAAAPTVILNWTAGLKK
ncbi:MAG: protein kinase [Acidobacteriaceae bacterium]